MKVWLVLAQHGYETDVVAVCKLKRDAESYRETEQENYRAAGWDTKIVVEDWEVE